MAFDAAPATAPTLALGVVGSTSLEYIPDGIAGTRATLVHMRALVKQAKQDPRIFELSRQITVQCGRRDYVNMARCIQAWVQANVRVVDDPVGLETLQDPWVTVQQGGDCDDHAMLVAALLEEVGIRARLHAVLPRDGGDEGHVYAEAYIAPAWFAVETTEPYSFGEKAEGDFINLYRTI